jgi:predicted AlkP superfamily pyrophosphatase or phosphodiesterase
MRTAPIFWPGSEAPIGGLRPTWWRLFDNASPAEQRVAETLHLLALPPAERPRLVTLYLQDADDQGHAHGPESPELAAAVARVDAAIAALLDGLARLGLAATTDVVVVADHGMAATGPGRAIVLDELVDPVRANVVSWSPVLTLWPPAGEVEAVYATLHGAHPHLAVYRRDELPARWRYRDSPRIPPLVAVADEGWFVTTRARAAADAESAGEHGYDPALPSMAAVFVAAGPSFRSGVVVPELANVAVYPLLCAALGIDPLPGDWDPAALPDVLAGRAALGPR